MKMFKRKSRRTVLEYDKENLKPVLRCSICIVEQLSGFLDSNRNVSAYKNRRLWGVSQSRRCRSDLFYIQLTCSRKTVNRRAIVSKKLHPVFRPYYLQLFALRIGQHIRVGEYHGTFDYNNFAGNYNMRYPYCLHRSRIYAFEPMLLKRPCLKASDQPFF